MKRSTQTEAGGARGGSLACFVLFLTLRSKNHGNARASIPTPNGRRQPPVACRLFFSRPSVRRPILNQTRLFKRLMSRLFLTPWSIHIAGRMDGWDRQSWDSNPRDRGRKNRTQARSFFVAATLLIWVTTQLWLT
jgi:hypothetical protein